MVEGITKLKVTVQKFGHKNFFPRIVYAIPIEKCVVVGTKKEWSLCFH